MATEIENTGDADHLNKATGIHLSKIRKTYGDAVAVADLDLHVNQGEFITFLGPSGCGKTTLLRIIAGLEEPDTGEVWLNGKLVFSAEKGVFIAPEGRNIGLIFQSYALWPHMTVERNITLALRERKIPVKEIAERLKNAIDMVQLNGYEERFPSELSGGQQQRVAVARLIAMGSSLLLMDEPLSNLDAMLRTDMRAEMKQLHRKLKATTIYVTHDQVEALTLSNVVVIMSEGEVQQQGSPYEIYHHPTNLFVAEFIGDPRVNKASGKLLETKGKTILDLGFIQLGLDRFDEYIGQKVLATIRPENVDISIDKPNQPAFQATLETVQPTGSETILQLRFQDRLFTVLRPGFIQLDLDQDYWLTINPKLVNLFDIDTEENLA